MKRAPVTVAMLAATFFALEPLVASPRLQTLSRLLGEVVIGLVAMAALVAVVEVLRREVLRVRAPAGRDVLPSFVLLAGFVVTVGLGLSLGPGSDSVAWLFRWIFEPLQSGMLTLVAFALVAAALRSFRLRSFEVAVLLLAACVVLLGRAPLSAEADTVLGAAQRWLVTVPNVAAQRALLLGAAIASLMTLARLALGLERDYLGERREP